MSRRSFPSSQRLCHFTPDLQTLFTHLPDITQKPTHSENIPYIIFTYTSNSASNNTPAELPTALVLTSKACPYSPIIRSYTTLSLHDNRQINNRLLESGGTPPHYLALAYQLGIEFGAI